MSYSKRKRVIFIRSQMGEAVHVVILREGSGIQGRGTKRHCHGGLGAAHLLMRDAQYLNESHQSPYG
jgi:hypothetical protein